MGNHDLDAAAGDAGLQPRQPGQLGRGDGGTPGAAQHGLQNDLLQLLPQRNLLRACGRDLNTTGHFLGKCTFSPALSCGVCRILNVAK